MPDEPTTGAGDGGSSSASFRRGVERADQTTSDEPHRPPATPPTGPPRPGPGGEQPDPSTRRPAGEPDRRPGEGGDTRRPSFVPPRQPPRGGPAHAEGATRPTPPSDRPSSDAPRPSADPDAVARTREVVSAARAAGTASDPPGADPEAVAKARAAVVAARAASHSDDPPEPAAPEPAVAAQAPDRSGRAGRGKGRVRARKVRRIVRHVEPWSVLKISVLFYAALFAIICVASAVLWNAARGTGTIDDVESFITEVGGFGKCEPVDGESPSTTTTTAAGGAAAPSTTVDQIDPAGGSTTIAPGDVVEEPPEDEESCREGEELVGEFKFEDGRIFQAFALGGIVLVLAGAAANVVLALLFNLISDLTGGVRVTVLEEDPPPRSGPRAGSPRPPRRE